MLWMNEMRSGWRKTIKKHAVKVQVVKCLGLALVRELQRVPAVIGAQNLEERKPNLTLFLRFQKMNLNWSWDYLKGSLMTVHPFYMSCVYSIYEFKDSSNLN